MGYLLLGFGLAGVLTTSKSRESRADTSIGEVLILACVGVGVVGFFYLLFKGFAALGNLAISALASLDIPTTDGERLKYLQQLAGHLLQDPLRLLAPERDAERHALWSILYQGCTTAELRKTCDAPQFAALCDRVLYILIFCSQQRVTPSRVSVAEIAPRLLAVEVDFVMLLGPHTRSMKRLRLELTEECEVSSVSLTPLDNFPEETDLPPPIAALADLSFGETVFPAPAEASAFYERQTTPEMREKMSLEQCEEILRVIHESDFAASFPGVLPESIVEGVATADGIQVSESGIITDSVTKQRHRLEFRLNFALNRGEDASWTLNSQQACFTKLEIHPIDILDTMPSELNLQQPQVPNELNPN